jgi:hypothetical protein
MAPGKRARTDHQGFHTSAAEGAEAPQLLCLLLEVRAQMHAMNTQLAHIGAQLERIDARVCHMECTRPARTLAIAPAGDATMAIRVAVSARAVRLLDLHDELLVLIAAQLAEDYELAVSLACRKLRMAVVGTKLRAAGARLSTSISSAFDSVGKLKWAASCGMPLSAELLNRAARAGQLEQLGWLRALGCAWEPLDEEDEDEPEEEESEDEEPADPCANAAFGGHLAVAQWAHANGCRCRVR